MLFTVIGTLSHELGHIVVAEILGYETTLHFSSMNWDSKLLYSSQHDLFILIGGPFQTMLTGCLGLSILLMRRNRIKFELIDWIAIFLSLFWLRPVFNFIVYFSSALVFQNGSYFGGDELKIALLLDVWEGTFTVLFSVLGALISIYLLFNIVPKKYQLTFLLSGILGGICGFLIWFKCLGPILLP